MAMPATLVLERLPGRLRLYLGGDLQFDTDDEAIYHERLVHPALVAARARFDGPLDVLVLGGGDGLAVRELLKHEAVRSIRVVDLNAEVVALARSELRPYNAGSLDDPRVEVTVADARDVLETAGRFHAIVSDLTFPTSKEDCALWTRDWFARLRTHLHPGGILTFNGISPERTPAAFWSVYQTLRTAGLHALPAHYDLPSFTELGYGPWGLFLASDRPIEPDEIGAGAMPAGVSTLDRAALEALFRFPAAWAEGRISARPNCDDGRTLFEALLDARSAPAAAEGDEGISFLGFADPIAPPDPIEPGAVGPGSRSWLDRQPGSGIDDLLSAVPLSHRIVTRELVKEWSAHLLQIATTLDLRRLVAALLRRAAMLPGRLVDELRRFRRLLARGERPVENLTTWGWRFFSVLMLVLVLSQTAMPTAAYAKGFSSSHSSSYHSYPSRTFFHSSGHRYGSSTSSSYQDAAGPEGDGSEARRFFGALLFGGGLLVTGIAVNRIQERTREDSGE